MTTGRSKLAGHGGAVRREALDRLLELDGQFYEKPDLVRMARIRADVLHASSAWGSDDDGTLLGWLADEVDRLGPYPDAFRREERRADDLATEAERLRGALEAAANALAWAERRMACPAYAEVIANDERNARTILSGETA